MKLLILGGLMLLVIIAMSYCLKVLIECADEEINEKYKRWLDGPDWSKNTYTPSSKIKPKK